MPKDKEGNIIIWNEFFSRWKQGIKEVTPYQQAKITYHNNYLILFGIICGLVISVFRYNELWWLAIILLGALGNTIVMQIGSYQKYKQLEQVNNFLNDCKEVADE